jgi:nitroreductase
MLDTIKNRRSVRDFQGEQITDEEINAIVEAGTYAPSGRGDQSWHFTVLQNHQLMGEISDAVKRYVYAASDNPFLQSRGNNPNYHLFYHAPTVIILAGNQDALLPQLDCAVCLENMLLAATSLNIGSCWISGIDLLSETDQGKTVIEKLNIPKEYKPYFSAAIGRKKNDYNHAPPRKENRVNYIR